jgi:hypothetical protein
MEDVIDLDVLHIPFSANLLRSLAGDTSTAALAVDVRVTVPNTIGSILPLLVISKASNAKCAAEPAAA